VIQRVLDCLEILADQAELLERFAEAEREVIGEAMKEKFVDLASRLVQCCGLATM
jgi:hypothetical protein